LRSDADLAEGSPAPRAPAPVDIAASRVPANDNSAPWIADLRRFLRRTSLALGVACAALAIGYWAGLSF
jgi:hypothetical protein